MLDLRALVAVADTGQLQAAGRQLQRSPASITGYVTRAEDEVGCRLLDRSVRPVVPTPAGRVFIDEVRVSLDALDRAATTARRVAESGGGPIRIGHNGTTGLDIVQRALAALDSDVRSLVRLVEGPSDTLIGRLLHHDLDVALVRPPLHHQDLEEALLTNQELTVIVPTNHPLAKSRSVHLAQLAGEPFVLPPRDISVGFHDHIVNACRYHGGFSPQLADEAGSAATFVALVSSGVGIALLPRPALTHCKTKGTKALKVLDPIPPLPLHLAWHRHNTNPYLLTLRTAITDTAT